MEASLFEDKDKKLFLLDGMALTYRAHYALVRSPRITAAGLCTSAVFGLSNTILDIIARQNPSHLAVAFDTPEPTARHEAFPEYKAHRDALPEDIEAQLPYVNRLFEAFHIPIIRCPGYEADDIIATLAREAEAQGFTTYMVTPDKDFEQLVTEHTLIFKPGRQGNQFEILGPSEVLKKWNIESVDQVIDILALMGDSSDNIPGVPGIGEKTAQKLIAEFGSVENLLHNTQKLKGKQRENIEQNAQQARLSRQLVTILLDVPHNVTLHDLRRQPPHEEQLRQLFVELEFDTLGKRLFGKNFTAAPQRAAVIREQREAAIQQRLFDEPVEAREIPDVPHRYAIVQFREQRQQLTQTLLAQKQVCFDTESTGLDPREALPLGIAFCFQPHEAYYVVCPEQESAAQEVLDDLRPFFEAEQIEKIGHNLKYDLSLLKWHGVEVSGSFMDTMLAHAMKEPEMRHGLDYLSQLYLGYTPIPTTALIGPPGPDQKNMRDVPLPELAEYACEDADVTWQIAAVLRPEIEKEGVSQVCYEVECPLVPVLVDMEFAGIRLDVHALQVYAEQLQHEIESLRDGIFAAAGREFNIDSPKQLGEVLYDELQLEPNPKKTATGQYSTRESELERLAGKHPVVRDVLEYRNAVKLKSVYVDQLPGYVNPRTGRVHTHYSQSWTATGRIQSNNPNLQTIPVRKERGREIRAAFIPRDDHYLILSADYSQIELRIMAELSRDEGMREAFATGIDIHTATAAKVYKVSLGDVTREMRAKAKMVNFGIIYGISPFGLQQRLNIPRDEAQDLITSYFETYPGVRAYMDRTIAFAREHGFVTTQTGRKRYLRDINSRNRGLQNTAERLAMNSPIQGTAADMLKLAMIRVHRALRAGGFRTKMLLTVHDEIVFDLYREEQASVLPAIEEAMRNALPMSVPIEVELGVGQNWLEAH